MSANEHDADTMPTTLIAALGTGIARANANRDPEGSIREFVDELTRGLDAPTVAVCRDADAHGLTVTYGAGPEGIAREGHRIVPGRDISWAGFEALLAGKPVQEQTGAGYLTALPLEGAETGSSLLAYAPQPSPGNDTIRAALRTAADLLGLLLRNLDAANHSDGGNRFDRVTGLYSVWALDEMVGPLVQRLAAGETDRDFDMVYLNIADFKTYNIQHGLEGGDDLLRRMAQAIRAAVGANHAMRYEADHFYVVCPSIRSIDFVSSVHDAMAEGDTHTQIHAGIYRITGQEDSTVQILDRAKIAGDAASGDFGRYWRRYDESMERDLNMRAYIVGNVDRAVNEGWIHVAYQPVVGTFSGELESFEALARWHDPVFGPLSPAQFIDTLERGHLAHKVDLEILRQVCEDIEQRRREGRAYAPVSVNLSRYDLELDRIHEQIDDILEAHGTPHDAIHFEITETALMQNEDLVREHVRTFHEHGYEVWLDDFGSGYSSLNTLRGFGFDCAKLDMVFMRDRSEGLEGFLGDLVTTCKHIGLKTLAEGVETEDQFQMLARIGCAKVQGYLFSKPAPLDVCLASIHSHGVSSSTPRERLLYDEIGMVDLRQGLLRTDETREIPGHERPLGIFVEDENARGREALRFVYVNAAGAAFAETMGVHSLMGDTTDVDYDGWFSSTIHSVARRLTEPGDIAPVRHTRNGVTANGYLRLISRQGPLAAYLLASDEQAERETAVRNDLDDLASLFDNVAVATPATDAFRHVHGHFVYDRGQTDNLGFADALAWLAENTVRPDERADFLAFVDPTTLLARCNAAPAGTINGFFNLRMTETLYELKRVVISHIPGTANPARFLMCIARNSAGWTREMIEQPNRPSPALIAGRPVHTDSLWNALAESGTLALFWKDTQRRFLGANKVFLDYHGVALNDILGKTDDEIGWNPEPEAIADDERAVLEHGATIRDTPGKVTVGGHDHSILINKMPVYEKGKVVALLGHISDTTLISHRLDELEAGFGALGETTSRTDAVTGLANPSGLFVYAERLTADFLARGEDFGNASLIVTGTNEFASAFGTAARDNLRRAIADALRSAAPAGSVIGRLYDDRYAILFKTNSADELDAVCVAAKKAVRSIRTVDGIPCSVYVASGGALYSWYRDKNLMVATSESSMMSDLISRTGAPRYNRSDIVRQMRREAQAWDYVRLVEPEGMHAQMLGADGELYEVPGTCAGFFGKEGRCADCVSLRTLHTGKAQRKIDTYGGKTCYVLAQRVEVSGRRYVLERIAQINAGPLSASAPGKLDARIASLEDENARLRRETLLDPLTGLFHRTGFNEAARPLTEDPRGAMVVEADVDDFKAFNDRWGHEVGDSLLCALADDLRAAFPDGPVARVGGDEFQVALAPADSQTVSRVRSFFEQTRSFSYGTRTLTYHVSAGYALVTKTPLPEAVAMASKALRRQKTIRDGKLTGWTADLEV